LFSAQGRKTAGHRTPNEAATALQELTARGHATGEEKNRSKGSARGEKGKKDSTAADR